MDPIRVTAANYGPFASVDWTIPVGLSAVLGRNEEREGVSSNGAGKTKLLEILPIALFGPRLAWSEYVTSGTVEEICSVGCEFEHGGETYRVRRAFDPKGRGKSTLDVERFFDSDPEENWVTLTRDTQAATQEALEDIIGFGEATFAHSVFSAQGAQHFADPNLPPSERKAILVEALGLGIWDELLEMVRADLKDADAELAVLLALDVDPELDAKIMEAQAGIVADRGSLSVVRASLDQDEALVASLAKQAEALRAQMSVIVEARAARDSARAEHAVLHTTVLQAATARDEAQKVAEQIALIVDQASTIEALEGRLDESRIAATAATERSRLLREAQETRQTAVGFSMRTGEIREQLQEAESRIDSTCDRCGQPLASAQARETMLNSLRSDLTTLETEQERLEAVAEDLVRRADAVVIPDVPASTEEIEQMLREAREADTQLARLETAYAGHSAALLRAQDETFTKAYADATDALSASETRLRAAEDSAPDPAGAQEMQASVNAARERARAHQSSLTLLESNIARLEERLTHLNAERDKGAEAAAKAAALQERVDVLKLLEQAYGRGGVPALILESSAIPQIEQEANRVLAEFGTDFRVELRTQRALKSSDRMRETLDVIVHEPNGERDYRTYSGGERTRIDLALRIGLAQLIAGRRGADVKCLCLDEPEFLDAAGLARLPEVLRSLTEFSKVVVISHDEGLLDRFDQTVTVERTGDRSVLKVAA